MSIETSCPDCGQTFRFSDQKLGKTTRCKACGSKFEIRRSQNSVNANYSQLFKGVFVGVGLFIIVLAVFKFTNQPQAPVPAVAVNDNNTTGENSVDTNLTIPQPQVNSPRPPLANNSNANRPANPTSAVASVPDSTATSPTPSGGFNPSTATTGGFQKPADETLVRSSNWDVQVDTLPGDLNFAMGKKIAPELTNYIFNSENDLVFSHGPSSFVAIISQNSGKKVQLFDVSTGKKIVDLPTSYSIRVAISPDGKYLANASNSREISVYDTGKKESLGTLPLNDKGEFNMKAFAVWPDRLIAWSDVHKTIKVWELPSGLLKHHITCGDKFSSMFGICFSPGGKYLAVMGEFLKKQIDFYNLETGEIAGSITPPEKSKYGALEAMGFSRSGEQFLVNFDYGDYSSGKGTRVTLWQVESGKQTKNFWITPTLKQQLEPHTYCHNLESFPDESRWLVHGLGIIDTDAEKLIYQFQGSDRNNLVPSRRVMGNDWVFSAQRINDTPLVEYEVVTEETLTAGLKAAESGGFATDAKLPPLTATDYQAAPPRTINTNWNYQPDPLEPSSLKDAMPISLEGTLRDLFLTRSRQPVIVARSGVQENLNDPEVKNYESNLAIRRSFGLELERPQPICEKSAFVLMNAMGEKQSEFSLDYSVRLRSASPDGKRILVEEHRTNGRLDVFDETGVHIAGWRPYRGEKEKEKREIFKAEMIDANHVVTLGKCEQLVVWKLPELEPVWRTDNIYDFELSPTGSQLAAIEGDYFQAKNVAYFDPLSGEGLGNTGLSGRVKSLAFHPQGELLAVAESTEANHTLLVIDLKTGSVTQNIAIPEAALSLDWTSQEFLLINGHQLISRPLQALVWNYKADDALFPSRQISESLAILKINNRGGVLKTVQLPDAQTQKRIQPEQLAQLAILKPGDRVRLNLEISGDNLLEPLRANAKLAVENALKEAGLGVDDKAAVMLHVKASLTSSGNVDLRSLTDRSQSTNVTRKAIEITMGFFSNSSEIWQTRSTSSNLSFGIVHVKSDDSVQTQIDKRMVEQAESSLTRTKLPKYLFKPEAKNGLGSSSVWE